MNKIQTFRSISNVKDVEQAMADGAVKFLEVTDFPRPGQSTLADVFMEIKGGGRRRMLMSKATARRLGACA